MPFTRKFTDDDLVDFLSQYGNDISASHVKTAADHLGVQVQSVTKRMNKIPRLTKVTRGKWFLTAQDLIDAYEKGIDVREGETLTEYINRIRAGEK